jgi:uncharacterized protein YndB with AHSA1/START domain
MTETGGASRKNIYLPNDRRPLMIPMTKKQLFTADYELHASVKMLYPYIQSASGLSEWFADDVRISPEKVFTFVWDHESHKAVISAQRTNNFVRFEYLPESEDDRKDPSYVELNLETNELTQRTFLKIYDYSDFNDMVELQELWDGLIGNLKTVVGG